MVAKPLAKIATPAACSVVISTADLWHEAPSSLGGLAQERADYFLDSWPGVRYICNSALEVSFVSQNIAEITGADPEAFIGNRAIWERIVLQEDLSLVFDRLHASENSGSISFSHRIADRHGLPVWVSHSVRRTLSQKVGRLYGCIMPIGNQGHAAFLEPSTISRFVHKMGNQFQLLNLIVNSLRKSFPESGEVDALEETEEQVVRLLRAFSEYSQDPTWVSAVELGEIIEAAAMTRSSLFVHKGIDLKRKVDPTLRDLTMEGDPYLLELAIGEVIQNALEATNEGGEVILDARVECFAGKPRAAKVSVRDGGYGIEPGDIEKVKAPFFSTKSRHDGLGLSMAARFVELHGGLLRVISNPRQGTEVQITFPVHERRDDSCR